MTSDRPVPQRGGASPRSIRVFLADDHTVVRDGLRMVLEDQPDLCVVGEASDGREAVRRCEEIGPDVAVLDITMPEMNGIEATRLIHETCPQTRVVILSMHAAAEHVYNALAAGACGYVLKESAGREVVAAVRAAHVGRRYLSDRITGTLIDSFLFSFGKLNAKSPLESLTCREREVLQMVAEGKSSKEIATILGLSRKTVESYRSRVKCKLKVKDLSTMIKLAVKYGLTPPE